MKKTLLLSLVVILIISCGWVVSEFLLPLLKPTNGQLNIVVTGKKANVYLDNHLLGQTPLFRKDLPVGDHKIKIVDPKNNQTWLGSVTLTSAILSSITLDLGPNPKFFSGEILYFRPGDQGLTLITKPNQTTAQIDNLGKLTTPLTNNLAPGAHILTVKKDGYLSREISVKALAGYKLAVTVLLSVDPFGTISKFASTDKLALFRISNQFVDLTKSVPEWVEAVKYFQTDLDANQTKFDLLIDESGKLYELNPDSWTAKTATKTAANIGYLTSFGAPLTQEAEKSWAKLAETFSK